MAKSLEQTVTELADRDAIRELPLRYCDCVWRGDLEGVVDLFTEDGTFAQLGRRSENSTTDRANLLKTYREGLTSLSPCPYIHNHVVELSPTKSQFFNDIARWGSMKHDCNRSTRLRLAR